MAHIEFLDETMRDGQQSLWGMRMQAGMALPVSPIVDRTGYRVIDLTGSSMFECLIKYCYENPWEGLDLLVKSMPNTPIRGGMRSNASVTFGVTPDSLMDAWMRQLNVHGVRSYWIYDVLFNIDKTYSSIDGPGFMVILNNVIFSNLDLSLSKTQYIALQSSLT